MFILYLQYRHIQMPVLPMTLQWRLFHCASRRTLGFASMTEDWLVFAGRGGQTQFLLKPWWICNDFSIVSILILLWHRNKRVCLIRQKALKDIKVLNHPCKYYEMRTVAFWEFLSRRHECKEGSLNIYTGAIFPANSFIFNIDVSEKMHCLYLFIIFFLTLKL